MNARINRNRLVKIFLPILLIALILASIALATSGFRSRFQTATAVSETRADAGPEVVATVEGHKITAKIYRMYLKNGIEAVGLNEKTEEGRRQIELLKEGIVSELVDRALVEAEARRRSLPIPEDAFNAAYRQRIVQMGGDEPFRAYLSEHGLSEQDFRQMVAQELYGERLQEELGKEVSVASDEISSFYDKEKASTNFAAMFKEPATVRASHILIAARRSSITSDLRSKGGANPAELERLVREELNKRRERAAVLLRKAKSGADFARLARELSEDPGTRNRGGDLGLFTRDTHTVKFDEAAFALKPGQISELIETEFGFHIIKVSEHRPERLKGLNEVRASIEQHLLARKRAEYLTQWLERRRQESDIRIDPFYQVSQLSTDKGRPYEE